MTTEALIKTHRLAFPAVLAINRNSFATELIGHFIGLIDSGNRRFFVEVDGLADRGIAMLLKSRLHPNVPLRLDIVGSSEYPAYIGGNSGYFLNTACPGDLFFKLFAVNPPFFSHSFENRIYLQHFRVIQYLAVKHQRINRFYAGRTIGDNAYRAGWSNACKRCITNLRSFPGLPDTAFPVGKRTA